MKTNKISTGCAYDSEQRLMFRGGFEQPDTQSSHQDVAKSKDTNDHTKNHDLVEDIKASAALLKDDIKNPDLSDHVSLKKYQEKILAHSEKIISLLGSSNISILDKEISTLIEEHISFLGKMFSSGKFALRQMASDSLKRIGFQFEAQFEGQKFTTMVGVNIPNKENDVEVRQRLLGLKQRLETGIFPELVLFWSKKYSAPELTQILEILAKQKESGMPMNEFAFRIPILLESALRSGLPPSVLFAFRANISSSETDTFIDSWLLEKEVYTNDQLVSIINRKPQEAFVVSAALRQLDKRGYDLLESLAEELLSGPRKDSFGREILNILSSLHSSKGVSFARGILKGPDADLKGAALKYLLSIDDKEGLAFLDTAFKSTENFKDFSSILHYLADTDSKPVLTILRKALENSNLSDDARYYALESLRNSRSTEAHGWIITYAQSQDSFLHDAALSKLPRNGESYSLIFDKCKNCKDVSQLSKLIGSLYSQYNEWDMDEVVTFLTKTLVETKDEQVARSSLIALMAIPDAEILNPKITEFWVKMLSHSLPIVRGSAASKFRTLKSESAVLPIQKIADDKEIDAFSRQQAIFALGDMGFVSVRSWLLNRYQQEFKTGNDEASTVTWSALSSVGLSDNFQELKKYVVGDNPYLAEVALRDISKSKAQNATEFLWEIARKNKSDLQLSSILLLIERKDTGVVAYIKTLAALDPVPEQLLRRIFVALSSISTEENISFLELFVMEHYEMNPEGSSDTLSDVAIETIAKIGTDKAIDAIFRLQKNTKAWVKPYAVLSRVDKPRVRERLLTIVRDDDSFYAKESADVLKELWRSDDRSEGKWD